MRQKLKTTRKIVSCVYAILTEAGYVPCRYGTLGFRASLGERRNPKTMVFERYVMVEYKQTGPKYDLVASAAVLQAIQHILNGEGFALIYYPPGLYPAYLVEVLSV